MILDVGIAIDAVRADLAGAMPDFSANQGTLYRRDPTERDSYGEQDGALVEVESEIPCKYGRAGQALITAARQMFAAGSVLAEVTHVLTIPYGIEVRNGDVFVVDATDTVAAKTFKVVGAIHKSMAIFQEVAVAEDASADAAERDAAE